MRIHYDYEDLSLIRWKIKPLRTQALSKPLRWDIISTWSIFKRSTEWTDHDSFRESSVSVCFSLSLADSLPLCWLGWLHFFSWKRLLSSVGDSSYLFLKIPQGWESVLSSARWQLSVAGGNRYDCGWVWSFTGWRWWRPKEKKNKKTLQIVFLWTLTHFPDDQKRCV